ncbi:MAG: YhcN/YlaJ family sporulation lipoprotein [Bacillota bacterium]
MTKRILFAFTIFALVTFSLMGCTPTRKPVPPGPQPPSQNQVTPAPNNAGDADLKQRADKIADNVNKIQGVEKSHVVLSENTAYIGLDLEKDAEGNLVDKVKKEAEAEAKKTDSKLKNIMVTTDTDSVERIKKVAEGVKEGKPLSSFGKELEEIGRRLKPSTEM